MKPLIERERMAGKRKGARMIQEIQRLKGLGLGKKAIARSLRISRNTVKQYCVSKNDICRLNRKKSVA